MSRLEELIQELCPNGVEWQNLESVCKQIFAGGTPNTAISEYYDGDIPWIRSGEINFNIIKKSERCITELGYRNSSAKLIEAQSVVMAMTGATVAKSAIVDIELTANQSVCALVPLRKVLNYKFLYYCLSNMYNDLKSKGQGALTSLNLKMIKEVRIPVPPMEVQCEIVHLLDQFTLLTAELTAELIARKQQYEYYSNYLFDLAKKNKTIYIKDCCSVIKGKSPIQKTEPGEFPMVVTTSERKTSKEYQFDSKSVCIPLISSRGHGVASLNHVYYQEGKFALGNILCAVTPNNYNEVCSKYLYYYFELTKDYTLVPLMKGGANVAMHLTDVQNVKIPLPPLEEQQRIVDILDKFDAYCNDLTQGLPAEIELRKQQYEYYRDKLLSFKELK